jgi:hypothetical protein
MERVSFLEVFEGGADEIFKVTKTKQIPETVVKN